MKKLTLIFFLFNFLLCNSQINQTFFILDKNDDVNEQLSNAPEFEKEYLKLGRSNDERPLRIGLRYQNVTIPKGSEILSAYIQFTSFMGSENDTVTMKIMGELSTNAEPFSNDINEIYNRNPTFHGTLWTTQNWQAFIPGPDQKTEDLKEILQEIIDQDGWNSGNAVHIKMYKYSFGTDSLLACSYDYMGEMYAPQLQVEYINWSYLGESSESCKISVYPNPVDNDFNIFFKNTENDHYSISILDILGKELPIYEGVLNKGDHNFQISAINEGLVSGLYFILIKNSEEILSRKIVIN